MKTTAQITQEREATRATAKAAHDDAREKASTISALIVAMRQASPDQIIAAVDAQGLNTNDLEKISNGVGRLPHANLWSR